MNLYKNIIILIALSVAVTFALCAGLKQIKFKPVTSPKENELANFSYEPIKIVLKNDKIESALYRWHWQHIRISNPYLDEKSRIHAFFIPYFNTPMIRRSVEDVVFSIFIDCFNAVPKSYDVEYKKPIPEYSISKGTKYKHPPKVEYSGWPE